MLKLITYIPTISALVIITLLLYFKSKNNLPQRLFFYTSLLITLWVTSLAIADFSQVATVSLFFVRLAVGFATLVSLSFCVFAINYPNRSNLNKYNYLLISIPALLVVLNIFNPMMIESIKVENYGAAIEQSGIIYLIHSAVSFIYFITGFVILIVKRRKLDSRSKNQINLILFGAGTAYFFNLLSGTVLSDLGITGPTLLLGVISIVVFVGSITYAIIRRQLFDIRLVVARSVAYLLSIGVIAIVYGFIAFRALDAIFPNASKSFEQTTDAMLAIILAFTFSPILRFFSKVSNRIFYRDKYDAQALINDVGRILASDIDLDSVSQKVVKEITEQMKIEKGEIVVFGEKQLFYENNVFVSNENKISQKELRKFGRKILVLDEVAGGERKELMQKYDINVSLALHTSEQFIGYLLLSQKKSGDIYNTEDLNVLKTLGTEISVAVQNALSYKEIQLFSETLAQKVRERTEQLRSANDQLRILDQAKDEFISMASHQLRTPLTTVKGYASMLEEGDFGKLSKDQKEPVQLALDGANRMARLIDDLLNVSRMDANRFFLEITEVDMVKLVDQELQQLKSLAESKKVKISYSPPTKKIPSIRLDENKTRQVVMNLVDNAIHYSQPPMGGGEANISLRLNGDRIEFIVKDNGIGVPAAVQKKLFTKMFRANNAKATRPDGTGLGLYLVKRVVQDQGGEIIFESNEGKGSTFGFSLPLSGVPKKVEEMSRKIGAKVASSQNNN